ncbi:DUF1761 domain-containing protein [Roseibium sp.]|uniref:DUF1761 domain-containing protein n=1 Tax=Roseibium sp. TaxID=1936156 RepID=UPI003A97C875
MMFDGINLTAVAVAGVASFLFGALWYGILGKAWMTAARLDPERTRPAALTMAIALVCQLLMAFVFAGVIYHLGNNGLKTGLISAGMIWTGFILTSQIVNHRFQGASWLLTLIDSGHWLGVLVVQALVITLWG